VEYIPTHEEICDAIREHLAGMVDLYGEQQAMVDGRKIVLAYMRGRGYHRALKNPICKMVNWSDFERILASIIADRDAEERLGISADATLQDL
jgi:tRNA-dihydrouridine synthase